MRPSKTQEILDVLAEYPDDMPLMSLIEALTWPPLTPVERKAVRWVRRRDCQLDGFEMALWDAITRADHLQLALLSRAYPVEVEAVRRWRSDPEFVARLRGMPFAFSLT